MNKVKNIPLKKVALTRSREHLLWAAFSDTFCDVKKDAFDDDEIDFAPDTWDKDVIVQWDIITGFIWEIEKKIFQDVFKKRRDVIVLNWNYEE